MKQNKTYKTAPLPFMGQKRGFLKAFKEVLEEYPPNATYVDLFGGSGLLSHAVKIVHPNANVVYNDFDNYRKRLTAIPQTNELLSKIRKITKNLERKKRIPACERLKIIKTIEAFEKKNGFVDYITLSSSLLFSMNYAQSLKELKSQVFLQ